MTLQEFFKEAPKAAVAFSGGADSAFLLWAARGIRCGCPGLLCEDGLPAGF